jgi:cephalosporin-C deacetylase-like acetyl esterase
MQILFRALRFAGVLLLLILAALLLWLGWTWISITSRDVEFRNGDLVLRGTLVSPRFAARAPAVVLVGGSGETSRKSTIQYAWIFASQGYAALAYDKRGVGKSDGGAH